MYLHSKISHIEDKNTVDQSWENLRGLTPTCWLDWRLADSRWSWGSEFEDRTWVRRRHSDSLLQTEWPSTGEAVTVVSWRYNGAHSPTSWLWLRSKSLRKKQPCNGCRVDTEFWDKSTCVRVGNQLYASPPTFDMLLSSNERVWRRTQLLNLGI